MRFLQRGNQCFGLSLAVALRKGCLSLCFCACGTGGDLAAYVAYPSNFLTALQEQLGLKLVPKKVIIEIFVIDHIEKTPTEN
jgi:hypothetical protein